MTDLTLSHWMNSYTIHFILDEKMKGSIGFRLTSCDIGHLYNLLGHKPTNRYDDYIFKLGEIEKTDHTNNSGTYIYTEGRDK